MLQIWLALIGWRECSDVHLGVEDASSWLDDADSLVESLDLVDVTSLARDNGDQVETEINWVQVGSEGVGKSPLCASWNLDIVSGSSQVANNRSTGRSICGQCLKS